MERNPIDGAYITVTTPERSEWNPERSEWKCYLLGGGDDGIVYRPLKEKEPNWFWRKMQYLAFGCKWVKAKP